MRKTLISAVAVIATLAVAGCSSSGGDGGTSQPGQAPSAIASTQSLLPRPASAAVLAGRLETAGMPVRHLITYTATTDPNHLLGRQDGYTSKVAWQDPRAARQDTGDTRGSVGLGGGIEAYPTAAGARARYEYLRGFSPPFGDGYDYLDGTAILRLSQYLTPAQARAYKAAFIAAVGQ